MHNIRLSIPTYVHVCTPSGRLLIVLRGGGLNRRIEGNQSGHTCGEGDGQDGCEENKSPGRYYGIGTDELERGRLCQATRCKGAGFGGWRC